MLDVIGVGSLEALLAQTVPATIRTDDAPLGLPPARTGVEVLAALRELAADNRASDQPDRDGLLRHHHTAG